MFFWQISILPTFFRLSVDYLQSVTHTNDAAIRLSGLVVYDVAHHKRYPINKMQLHVIIIFPTLNVDTGNISTVAQPMKKHLSRNALI